MSSGGDSSGGGSSSSDNKEKDKQKEKARVSRTSLILWHAHQNDAAAVRKLLQEDPSLVKARDYDNRTPLHVAALHGWLDVANCLIEFGADVNAQDRWKNTPLADAEGASRTSVIELLKSHGGLSFIDFSNSTRIGKGSFGEILKAYWRGTPVAVKRILPSLSDDRLVIQDFRHEVNLLVKLRHPNIVQFLGAVTDRTPLMLITEYLRGGDLHQYLKDKGSLSPSTAVNFSMDIARGMAYLHNEPNVIIHRDLKPRNVLLVNSSADHLKVGDFGLSKIIKVKNAHDVYKMTGETGSCEYDKKVDVYSFAMILYEMLEGEPPFASYEPYDAAKRAAEGHRPTFRAKGYTPEMQELTLQCWAADMNQRPSFIDILKRLEKIKESLPSDHHWHLFTS
ncbi:hypothetical protein PIB30_008791 [Stylosanthes scabra]|uniref:Protein kinase domain-containing protein n=1 Tax=Stylosanthes scabra TaxID=79078 RepID=A0ABU6W668_9FABA|nr:hypothetical protein [Stylosanthes scabra]